MSRSEFNLIDFSMESDKKFQDEEEAANLLGESKFKNIGNSIKNFAYQTNYTDDPFDPFEKVLKDSQIIQSNCENKVNPMNCSDLLWFSNAKNNIRNTKSINMGLNCLKNLNCDINLESSTLDISSGDLNVSAKIGTVNSDNDFTKLNSTKMNNNDCDTPVCKEKSEASTFKNSMFSKLLDESYEDLMSINPKWIDSESDIESDLEMLRIPILEKLDIKNSSASFNENENTIKSIDTHFNGGSENRSLKQISNSLEVLKERVKMQKCNSNKKDVTELINNLKDVIMKCSNEIKKTVANDLLKSLESLLNDNESTMLVDEKNETITSDISTLSPSETVASQGTFENHEMEKKTGEKVEYMVDELLINENQDGEIKNIESNKNSSPNILIMKSPTQGIIAQIKKILTEQNILPQFSENLTNSENNSTYIFVMNTPKRLIRQETEIFNKSKFISDDENNGNQKQFRRRSFSLSEKKQTKSFLTSNSSFKTPQLSGYRKSVNITPIPKIVESKRKLLQEKENEERPSKPRNFLRRSVNIINQIEKVDKSSRAMSTTLKTNTNSSKLRLKSNEINPKTLGPLKATVPIINVTSMLTNNQNLSHASASKAQTLPKQKKTIPLNSNIKFTTTTTATRTSSCQSLLTASPGFAVKPSHTRHSNLSMSQNSVLLKTDQTSYNNRRKSSILNKLSKTGILDKNGVATQVKTTKATIKSSPVNTAHKHNLKQDIKENERK